MDNATLGIRDKYLAAFAFAFSLISYIGFYIIMKQDNELLKAMAYSSSAAFFTVLKQSSSSGPNTIGNSETTNVLVKPDKKLEE